MSSLAFRVFLFVGSFMSFATCANSKQVDIRLLGVDLVSYSATLPTEWLYGGKRGTPPPSLEWLLRVRFSASPPVSIANFRDYNVVAVAYPCSMRAQFEDAKEDLDASGIIEHGVALPVPFTSKGDSPTPRPTTLPEYYDYLALVPSPNSELGQRRAYDLIHSSEDICVKIAGGKIWYLGV